jgi:glucose/arabinose dehydrogenase
MVYYPLSGVLGNLAMLWRRLSNHQNVRFSDADRHQETQARSVVEGTLCGASPALLAWRHALAVGSVLMSSAVAEAQSVSAPAAAALEGKAAYGDWQSDGPGVRRHIWASDLPAPYSTASIANSVRVVGRPADAQLKVPPGFRVGLFARGLDEPRLIRVAPNGDVFVAESSAGRIRLLRPTVSGDRVSRDVIFASGLNLPFGIAFYPNGKDPQWLYVANTDSVVRFHYHNDDLQAQSNAEIVVPKLPVGGSHWTRDIAFSRDDRRMFISVGSASNAAESSGAFGTGSPRRWLAAARDWIKATLRGGATDAEAERADVLVFDPSGKDRRVYASGIRNCVGMAINPSTGDLWCSVNERDGLGDDLPPDYITRVPEDGFFGWPYYYIGANEDPLHRGARPDLKDKVITPDILIQPHSASLQMMFYTGGQFPAAYRGSIFAAEHGSWNRAKRTGYKIIHAIVKDGVPSGEYEDFVTGFVIDDTSVWGRPVGVAQAKDGSLLFSEDGNGTIWRVTSIDRAADGQSPR